MRAHVALGSIAMSCLLPACGAPPAPPPAPPSAEIAVPPPPAPPAPPALLMVPRAEASPRSTPAPKAPTLAKLRSEGKRHAIERTAEGFVVVSQERGVIGFLKSPVAGAEIRWAGFVDDDAVLIATPDAIHRAETVDDAIAGKVAALGALDPTATRIASGGQTVVAVNPAEGGVFLVSRDSGKHFAAEKRPGLARINDLAVRADGFVVVAIETGPIPQARDDKGVRCETWFGRGARAFQKGPPADALYSPAFHHSGDTISMLSPKPKKIDPAKKESDPWQRTWLGLDAKGKWIETDYAKSWLWFTWTDAYIEVGVPEDRPGYPKPAAKDDLGGLGMIGGALAGDCRGAACLAHRSFASGPARVRVFHDGVCAKEHVIQRTETINFVDGARKSEKHTYPACDENAPAQRASTLLLHGDAPRVARLPLTCAKGRVFGTERDAFVQCAPTHAQRASIQRVSADGSLVEIAAAPRPGEVSLRGVESASDGTTVVVADKAAWVCRPEPAGCTPVERPGVLAARPLPGGRALLAVRGAGDDELWLDLFGEPGAAPVRVPVSANVLEIEVTAEGYVRLWTSAKRKWFTADPQARARDGIVSALARTDGQLVPE
ncbi:Hypothetical protein A7982_05893 [Minicystis rosea]|nr:Hypothetical protein A7982_05893 [Minicystis rosea]